VRSTDVLVADPLASVIHRFALDGTRQADFAAAALQQHFAPALQRRDTWRRRAALALIVLVGTLVMLPLLGGWRRRVRLRQILGAGAA
jgi:hypothetical protein